VTTLYSVLLHTFQCPQSRLHCRCLVAAYNDLRSSSSELPNSLRPLLPVSNSKSSPRPNLSSPLTNSLTNQIFANFTDPSLVLVITSRHGQRRKHHSSVAAQLLPWNCCFRVCWWCLYLTTAVVQLLISLTLPINGTTCHNIHLISLQPTSRLSISK
jgi:hypothetical protein